MKQLSEVLLVPVEYNVEVGVAGDETGIEFGVGGEDFDFAEFELEVFHEYWVVGVVLEEHDVIVVVEAVGFVWAIFEEGH